MNNYQYCVLQGLIESIEKHGGTVPGNLLNELISRQNGKPPRPLSMFKIELYNLRHRLIAEHIARLPN